LSAANSREAPTPAGPELACLLHWEQVSGWMLERTAKWPKSMRFALVQKVDLHVLEVLDALVVARYEPRERVHCLREANLRLERLRFLLRIALARQALSKSHFETAMRSIDELGRMLHGWRTALGERRETTP
jgi:hypothetical protein